MSEGQEVRVTNLHKNNVALLIKLHIRARGFTKRKTGGIVYPKGRQPSRVVFVFSSSFLGTAISLRVAPSGVSNAVRTVVSSASNH